MAVKWTEEQKSAISSRNCSLLVAAAAGSGKTAVLVERIIQRILDPNEGVDIDRLIIVTFTEAAASEMRERIERAVSERIANITEKDGRDFKNRLKRQLTLLNRATITTMHSFCAKVIRTNFNKINIDPNFKIIDAIEADIMKAESLDHIMDIMYESEEDRENFEMAVDIYGGSRNDEGLKKLILNIYEYINSCPFPGKWLEENIRRFYSEQPMDEAEDFRSTVWGDFIFSKLKKELPQLIQACEYAIELCERGGADSYVGNFRRYKGFFEILMTNIENGYTWDNVYDELRNFEIKRFPPKTKGCDEKILDSVSNIAENIKDTLKEYGDVLFAKDSAGNRSDLENIRKPLQTVGALVLAFSKEYRERKERKKYADYNDLEHFALRILTENPDIADGFKSYYEEVYTDEYQDTNLTQETILSLISRKKPDVPNLFMVGDVKQSIYGFRQARPDIFMKKYESFSTEDYLKKGERLIKLYKNFRSRRDVIGGVNYIFSAVMTKEICGMGYGTEEYLYYGADYENADWDVSCELMLSDIKERDGELSDRKKTEFEAAMIAARIKELIGENPKIKYKDIVILLRATKDRADVYKEILSQFRIPAYCDVNTGFYQSKEIKLIISFLQIIDNPIQDIPLTAVLKSPAGGFDENDIADLRCQGREESVYKNLRDLACSGNSELSQKASVFLDKLNGLRDAAADMKLSELILKLYRDTDCFDYSGVFEDGNERQANLRKLYDEAVNYERETGCGVFEFLYYTDKIKESSGDMGSAAVLGENDDVVRIMSIHKSKGLEFPIVFLANIDKGFNRRDLSDSIIMHQDLGFGADAFDTELRAKWDTVTKNVIKLKINEEMIAEEMRLLYVAMTRAKEKIILSGIISGAQKTLKKYWGVISPGSKKIPSFYALSARSFCDFLIPVLIRHPGMAGLRDMADIEWAEEDIIYPGEEESCDFKFIYKEINQLFLTVGQEETKNFLPEQEVEDISSKTVTEENEIYRELCRRLDYKYPYAEAAKMPVKVSVSQIKAADEIPRLVKNPAFLDREGKRDAAEMGTITHYIMQHIDFKEISEDSIRSLCRKQGLTEAECENFNVRPIMDFFKSDMGRRMINSGNAKREIPFTLKVGAWELYDIRCGRDEEILVQGIIDCCFEEEDGLVVIDYKTDELGMGEGKKAVEKYSLQLDLYARALEEETKKKVKEKNICFLSTGENIQI